MMDEGQRKNISTGLSALLRHNGQGKLRIDGEGWADLTAVTSLIAEGGRARSAGIVIDRGVIEAVVREDDKGRFEIADDGLRIRATSGHSFEVELGLAPYVPEGPLWFGTVIDREEDILRDGLVNSTKLKVRLVTTEERATEIAIQRGCAGPLVLEIDAVALARDGYEFGINGAGEILVPKFGPQYVAVVRQTQLKP